MLLIAIASWVIWVLGIVALSCLATAFLVLRRGKKKEGGSLRSIDSARRFVIRPTTFVEGESSGDRSGKVLVVVRSRLGDSLAR